MLTRRRTALLLLLAPPWVTFAQEIEPVLSAEYEYALKAEYIERFTRFVEWPSGSSAQDSAQPFVIAVVGNNPFGDYLEAIARDRQIRGKDVRVRAISSPSEITTCEVLFIASSERSRLDEILARVGQHPVLTIADSRGFARRGVIINFVRQGEHLGFEVNLERARASGLELSSKLLRLAKLVGVEEPG